jgi:phosphoribosylaminoimidazolecarboxamide formyltransferase/IMP cyclohydrolase
MRLSQIVTDDYDALLAELDTNDWSNTGVAAAVGANRLYPGLPYDTAVSTWMAGAVGHHAMVVRGTFKQTMRMVRTAIRALRFIWMMLERPGVATAHQVKNYLIIASTYRCRFFELVAEFDPADGPAVAIVNTRTRGVARGPTLLEAYEHLWCDRTSALAGLWR